MYLIGSLLHGEDSETTKYGKKRKRSRINYAYSGKSVCRHMAFDIGKHALASLVSHVKMGEQTPINHGNKERKPRHSLKNEDVHTVVYSELCRHLRSSTTSSTKSKW